jgi:hypothetical protein
MRALPVATLFFLACLTATPVAVFSQETLLYNETVIVYPAVGIYDSIVVTFDNIFPLNSTSALNFTLNTIPCNDDGTECDDANTVFAHAQLYCGTSADPILDFVSGKKRRRRCTLYGIQQI